MTDNNKTIEELSINQAMMTLCRRIDAICLVRPTELTDKAFIAFHVLESALTKAHEDNHSKIKEIASILQEPVIKDFKQYNSKY